MRLDEVLKGFNLDLGRSTVIVLTEMRKQKGAVEIGSPDSTLPKNSLAPRPRLALVGWKMRCLDVRFPLHKTPPSVATEGLRASRRKGRPQLRAAECPAFRT